MTAFKPARIFIACLMGMLAAGCVTSSKHLTEIKLGMTKPQVIEIIGKPTMPRGVIENKFHQAVEVWQYTLVLPSTDTPGRTVGKHALGVLTLGLKSSLKGERKEFWLYFIDDRLAQWSVAGDWEKEVKKITETKFHTPPPPPVILPAPEVAK